MEKGSVIFKHSPSDFIVEEVWPNHICKISEVIQQKTDLSQLNENDRRSFLYCDLEKINIDHFTTFNILEKELNNFPHELGYAGTKDKLAHTCQRISIFNAKLDKIKEFSNTNIHLKNFKWAKHKIKIGDLESNRFTIILRDADKDAIKILNQVRKASSIPNYFGSQRFGSLRKDNVKIGKLILSKKYKEAVITFLSGVGENEDEEVVRAKKKFQKDKNLEKALDYFPRKLHAENRILQHLKQNKEDFSGALLTLGEKTLLIICQSVQSQIFNDLLERLIENKISLKEKSLPVLGYDYKFENNQIDKILIQILEDHNLTARDFKFQDLDFLSLKSSKRQAFLNVKNIEVTTQDDEIFGGKKIFLQFQLGSGNYATTFLEHFFELRSE